MSAVVHLPTSIWDEFTMKNIILMVLLVVLGACGNKSSEQLSTGTNNLLTLCPGFSEAGKPPIVQGAQCGSLAVHENPEDSASPKISLNILRLPAVNPTAQPDPLFVIAGGPGQSAVNVAEGIAYVFDDIRKNRDIVFVDQRGTGGSAPLDCLSLEDQDNLWSLAKQQQKLVQALRECIAQHEDRWAFYTTPYAVQDLESVRKALGYQQINLWSVSYGTRVALEYMRSYPEAIRTSTLDGVAPVSMALPWHSEEDAWASLTQLNEQCTSIDQCKKRFGNLLDKANAIAQRLDAAPINILVTHPRTQAQTSVEVDNKTFVVLIRMALYGRDLSTLVPLVISRSYDGDYQLLASLVTLIAEQSELADISYGMHYNILCNEDYPQYRGRNSADSHYFLKSNLVDLFSDICAIWPQTALDENYFSPVVADIPTLLLSGQRDPVTPPRWADLVMQHLSHAKHLVAPGGHHSITRDGCVSQLITLFVHRGSAESLDTSCVKNIDPFAPYLGFDPHPNEVINTQQQQDSQ